MTAAVYVGVEADGHTHEIRLPLDGLSPATRIDDAKADLLQRLAEEAS